MACRFLAGALVALLAGAGSAAPAFAGLDEAQTAWQRRDFAAAANEYRPLAAQGQPLAMARLGQILFQGLGGVSPDETEAIRLFKASAEAGEPLGQYWYGVAWLFGRGVAKDVGTAQVWLGRAADRDQPEALHALGELYFNGNGVARNEAKAADYFRRAADLGHPASLEKMAELRWNGRGIPVDRPRAVADARRAAEAGRPVAQFILGVALLTGDGVAKTPAEAAQWFRRAAERGHAQSAHNLGAMLTNGSGLIPNLAEGYFWLAVGAERAPPPLKPGYARERDAVAARLPAEDLARVRARLAAWQPATGPISAAAPLPPPAVATPAAPLRGRMATGTGFAVSEEGAVLTNAHVVQNCRAITVTPPDGQPLPATLAARTEKDDLALLKTAWRGEPVQFRSGRPVRSGDEVVVIGFPLSSLLSREANVTAGVVSAMNGLRGDQRFYQITAPVQKGNSGGPLVDMTGAVVGVVSAKLNAMKVADQTGDLPQNINFAIKDEVVHRFLKATGVVAPSAPAAPATLSVADVGEKIKRATMFIQCQMD